MCRWKLVIGVILVGLCCSLECLAVKFNTPSSLLMKSFPAATYEIQDASGAFPCRLEVTPEAGALRFSLVTKTNQALPYPVRMNLEFEKSSSSTALKVQIKSQDSSHKEIDISQSDPSGRSPKRLILLTDSSQQMLKQIVLVDPSGSAKSCWAIHPVKLKHKIEFTR